MTARATTLTLHRGRGGVVLRGLGRDVRLERLGRGLFATAYREVMSRGHAGGRVFVFVDAGVADKDIAAKVHAALPGNPHVPAVKRLGVVLGDDDTSEVVYAMPLYRAPLKRVDSERAWADYKLIRECDDLAHEEGLRRHAAARRRGTRSRWSGQDECAMTVRCLRERGARPTLVRAVAALARAAARRSPDDAKNYYIEVNRRSLATDRRGNLVLLDVLFHDAERRRAWRRCSRRR